MNPEFDDGIQCWSGRGCKIVLHNSMVDGKILPASGKCFASARERTATWHGIEQDITARVCRKLAYEVSATVRIFGNNVSNADVRATLFVQTSDRREEYIGIAKLVSSSLSVVNLIIFSHDSASFLHDVHECKILLSSLNYICHILLFRTSMTENLHVELYVF